MYADATQRAFSPHDQHSHQLPPHQQQQQRNPGQLQYYPDYCTNIQQTQPQITSNPLQSHVGGLQFHQQQAGQMQSYNGYNPNDAGSMPPPSSLGGMNINTIATRTNQQYQGHMRSNSKLLL